MPDDIEWPAPDPEQIITPDASPYVFENSFPGSLIVTGGTVTMVEISRDGSTFYNLSMLAGEFFLCPGDQLRITYILAPTIVWFPI